mgnify:CR=1 FL=1
MKKLVFVCALFMASTMAYAQAWSGKGDQKIQVGFNVYGYGTGVTGTSDSGISNILSVGSGAYIYFNDYKDNNKDNNFFVLVRLNAYLQKPLNFPSAWDIYSGIVVGVFVIFF